MIPLIDRWVVPWLALLADWSVRWGVVLVVLALMFGGFTKGTKSGSAPRFGTSYPMSTYYSG